MIWLLVEVLERRVLLLVLLLLLLLGVDLNCEVRVGTVESWSDAGVIQRTHNANRNIIDAWRTLLCHSF
jgi:hypothetical protein